MCFLNTHHRSGLGTLTDPIEPRHISYAVTLCPQLDDHQFAWILWYIWKGRNNKFFRHLDIDPRDTLKLVETESLLCIEAQTSLTREIDQTHSPIEVIVPVILGWWCFTDGSWKNQDAFLGQGWYSTLEGFDGLMGARNTRASQSPLHSEIEALIWEIKCMRNLRQFNVTFAMNCSMLVKIVSEPEIWPGFASYLEDIKVLTRSFNRPEFIHIPWTQNSRTDSLARSARKQSSFIVHMDAELTVWSAESSWFLFMLLEKKKLNAIGASISSKTNI